MKRFDFHSQLKRGKIGEKTLISLLKDEYIEYTIKDVSNVDEYKDKDIDIVMTNKNSGEEITVEIKSDETIYKSWNIFGEFCSCKRLGTPGWLLKTEADFICYAFINRGCYFMIPREVLLDMIKIYDFKIGEAYDQRKVSQGYLIPVNLVRDFINMKDEYKEKFQTAYNLAF
jgi:hypothetical protein